MYTFVCLTITPTIPFFNIFLKLCEQISRRQLEALLPTSLASEMAKIPSRAKASASLALSSLPRANNWDALLEPTVQSSSALMEGFCFFSFPLTTGRMFATRGALFPLGNSQANHPGLLCRLEATGCPRGYWWAATTAARTAWGGHHTPPSPAPNGHVAERPSLRAVSSPFLMFFLLCGLLFETIPRRTYL